MRFTIAAGLFLCAAPSLAVGQDPSKDDRSLFSSDMSEMAGLSSRDPMAGMTHPGWHWMTMGTARLAYNRQGGPSGGEVVESTNWIMGMGQRGLGKGRLTLMGMTSLEPATIQGEGSPHLFQSGEARHGRPLVDHQHPHDLFMNLSASYRRPIGEQAAWWAQLGLRGEPALGPTAFMHRASAGENPTATLGHHWQDSSHITDEVVTVGGGWRGLALEGSLFHGREPDEGRWDLDPGRFDSGSVRLRGGPWRDWSAQLSYGFLKDPEVLEPGDTHRTTASVHYGAAGEGPLAASLIWGRNREAHGTSDALLLEGAFQLTGRDQVYARAERVEKALELLLFKEQDTERVLEGALSRHDETTPIEALTLGYFREAWRGKRVRAGVGTDLTVYRFRSVLQPAYGDSPLAFHAFVRVRWDTGHAMPAGHSHGAHP